MLPRTLSASSLQVAQLCLVRWKSEYLNRNRGYSTHTAGDVGTSVHGGLEQFVDTCFIKKEKEPTWELLEVCYQKSYIETFGSHDFTSPEYKDGLNLTRRWWQRTDLTETEVVSVEQKHSIAIPGKYDGDEVEVPFNYIIDRLDRLAPGEYRVVDYKTQRVPITPDDLHEKLQARAYALAVQIQYPDAEKIRVQFDLLRHEPVGIIVTKEDNIDFWYELLATFQRLLDTKESEVEPTLNMECQYCPVKASCKLMQANIAGGGIHGLSTAELAELQYKLEAQMKGSKSLLAEIDDLLLMKAAHDDTLEWVEEDTGIKVEIKAQRRRQVNAMDVAQIIGPEEFAKLGNINLGTVDDLIKDASLPQETRDQLKELIYYTTGDPHAKVKPVKRIV